MATTRRPNPKGSGTPQANFSWNVLTTPWLEVTDSKARLKRVSVLDAIRDSAEIHRVAAAAPLDLFAIHRFLITLLYWQAESCGGVEKLRNSLLVGRIPRGLIKGLSDAAAHFELFDAKRPFLQDPSVKEAERLSAASLFSEMAAGTNVAHFHHGDDAAARLCLPCATRGLLRLVPWTQFGGRGKYASLHDAPPIMPLAMGTTLCETLGLNLVSVAVSMGTPRWSGQFKPSGRRSGLPLLEGLTWNPRRVHLGVPADTGLCMCCGNTSEPVIGPIVFAGNPACKNEAATETESWRDPAAFYRDRDGLVIRTSNEANASLRDDIRRLFEQRFGKKIEAAPVSRTVAANPDHGEWLVVMPCTNPANNKSYDHRSEVVRGFAGGAPVRARHWYDRVAWSAGDPRTLTPLPAVEPLPGVIRFVRMAALLDGASWAVLQSAANRSLTENPAAFDIFTGLYWPLRNKVRTAPSRTASWLTLKLMAMAGPFRPRSDSWTGQLRPWLELPRSDCPGGGSNYPRMIPSGLRLESDLHEAIRQKATQTPNARIDWPGLCQFINDVTH